LKRDLKAIEAGYGENVLNLTPARAYVQKLLNDPAVAWFMGNHYAEILAELTALVATELLNASAIPIRCLRVNKARLGRRVFLLLNIY
jgi:hypothetical protein